jgi:hypothetical protein
MSVVQEPADSHATSTMISFEKKVLSVVFRRPSRADFHFAAPLVALYMCAALVI